MMPILSERKDNKIKIGYGTAFFLLVLSCIFTWYAHKQSIEQSKWVMRTNMIIDHLDNLLSYAKDGETGVRGYYITKDESFLEPFYSGKRNTDSIYKLLDKEIEGDQQRSRLADVETMIEDKYGKMSLVIDYLRHENDLTQGAALKAIYDGKKIMDGLRLRISLMEITEQKVLQTRKDELQYRYKAVSTIMIVSLALSFFFIFFGFITYIRENKARKDADEKVKEYQAQLQKQIEELGIANKELIEMRGSEQFAVTGRIARTIAHEIRNPLTNIDLAASQVKMELNSTDDNMNMLFDMIDRNSKRINQLISELLNATRFSELAFEEVSIDALLEEALGLAKDRIDLYQVKVEKRFAKNKCYISVDPAKIKIAFLNIIVNAIEAMESQKQPVLKLVTKEENDRCVVEISDNGLGMDATSVNKLFEPYFTTKSKGNGLGLTNTQNIILNHGGTIHVESKKGNGTTFIIRFKLHG